jgi:hypothetical protein
MKNKEIPNEDIGEIEDQNSFEIENKPIKPKRKATENQKKAGQENLKIGREKLAVKRKEQRKLADEYNEKKQTLKAKKDFSPAEEEPPKKSVKDYVDEIEEHIKLKPKKKKIIYREESDSEEEVIIKKSSLSKKRQQQDKTASNPSNVVIPMIQFY